MGTSYKLRKTDDCTVLGVTGTTCIASLDCRKNGGDRVRKVSGKEIDDVIKEATKLLKDNPHLKIYQAVALAKETMKHRKKAPN